MPPRPLRVNVTPPHDNRINATTPLGCRNRAKQLTSRSNRAKQLTSRSKGALDGIAGGFALAHLGEMDAESEELRIGIVPGSGTGELLGIRGQLLIRREGDKHYYTLTYWTV